MELSPQQSSKVVKSKIKKDDSEPSTHQGLPHSALLPPKNKDKRQKKVQFMNVATEGEESGDVHDLNQNNEGSITGSV